MSIPAADLVLPPDVLAWEYLKADPVLSRQLYEDALFSVEAGDRALSESQP